MRNALDAEQEDVVHRETRGVYRPGAAAVRVPLGPPGRASARREGKRLIPVFINTKARGHQESERGKKNGHSVFQK